LKDEHESEVQGTDKNRELVDGTECYDSCTGDARGIDIHVVVGSLVRDIDGVRRFAECHENVILHENVENMAALMRSCDVAIAAAGTMLTECAAIGLPAIYYQVADNQKFNVEFWQRTGGMVFAGDVSSGDALEKQRVLASICDNIKRIMNNESDLLNMKASLSGITDGRGAIRISKAIIDL
jgi:spore coat polysaccharide biosynthesis predicted glycosyltransferase SpsG